MAKFSGQPPEFPGQCEAARSSDPSKRCRKSAIKGAVVCRTHGGGAPQVKQSARVRLASLVDPAIDVLQNILNPPKSGSIRGISRSILLKPELRVAVARDILDRNALKAKEELVLTHEFDSSRFAHMSDEEIEQLVLLARKASVQKDARGGSHSKE